MFSKCIVMVGVIVYSGLVFIFGCIVLTKYSMLLQRHHVDHQMAMLYYRALFPGLPAYASVQLI